MFVGGGGGGAGVGGGVGGGAGGGGAITGVQRGNEFQVDRRPRSTSYDVHADLHQSSV